MVISKQTGSLILTPALLMNMNTCDANVTRHGNSLTYFNCMVVVGWE
jgi:hypothetical protein